MGIKELVIAATARGAAEAQMKFTRRAVNAFAQQLRDVNGTRDMVEGIASLEGAMSSMLQAHMTPDAIAGGGSGTFDVCDLRHWLAIAERAGVPAIPATEILTLHSDEVDTVLGPVPVPDHFMSAISRRLRKALGDAPPLPRDESEPLDRAAIVEKIYAAGDRIAPGHVVRSAICGPESMKALAGTGTLSHADDAARFDDIRVGCGWVSDRNRIRVDVTDKRLLDAQARGHEDTFRYLMRPWVEAARRNVGPDPHFAHSPMPRDGSWPAEWRVFVQNGRVIGVGNYYGWAGEVSPVAARGALAARDAAERMIAAMAEQEILPIFSDVYLMNASMAQNADSAHPNAVAQALDVSERFPMDGIHCTLDFIETGDGEVTLLEGGPAHTPIGGGHPVAFCGCLAIEGNPMFTEIDGIAFRTADGIFMPEPSTFGMGRPEHALTFDEAESLAAQDLDPEIEP